MKVDHKWGKARKTEVLGQLLYIGQKRKRTVERVLDKTIIYVPLNSVDDGDTGVVVGSVK